MAVAGELVTALADGLAPIGKTDAHATIVQAPQSLDAWPPQPGVSNPDIVQVVLVSDALLFPTDAIADKPDVNLTAIYRNTFDELSLAAGCVGAMKLSHIFASQRLGGGEYLRMRFRRSAARGYQPFVLTEGRKRNADLFLAHLDELRRRYRFWCAPSRIGPDGQSVLVPLQQLEPITPTVAEDEQIPRERIVVEMVPNDGRAAIEGLPPVGRGRPEEHATG